MFRSVGLLFGALALLASSNAVAQTNRPPGGGAVTPRVISGDKVPEGAYPWMVALLFKYNGSATDEHYCGGTLVDRQWVMTAAHCVQAIGIENSTDIEVLIGQNKLSGTTGMRVPVRGAVIHPGYDRWTIKNDFALLKLEFPVPYETVTVANPSSDGALYQEGTLAKVIGWGVTDPLLPILPDDLQEASLPMVSDERCLEANGRIFSADSMVCAGELSAAGGATRRPDACFGDSGGPLVVFKNGKPIQLGIVSWGFECASPITYGVYSRTAAAYDFLQSRPEIAPFLAESDKLTVKGDFRVGGTVSANSVQWKGDLPTTMRYEWYLREESAGEFRLAATTSTNSVTLTEEFRGGMLRAQAIAINSGGAGKIESDPYFVSLDGGGDSSSPDTEKPTVSKVKQSFRAGVFEVFVETKDAAPSAGIRAVVAELTTVIPGQKKGGKNAATRRVIRDQISAAQISEGLYKFTIPAARGARYSLSVQAIDGAENKSEALSFRARKTK